MDYIEEHRGLAEHIEWPVLANANAQLDLPKKSEAQEQDAQFQRVVRKRWRILADVEPLLPRIVCAVQKHVTVSAHSSHNREDDEAGNPGKPKYIPSRNLALADGETDEVTTEHPSEYGDGQPGNHWVLDN